MKMVIDISEYVYDFIKKASRNHMLTVPHNHNDTPFCMVMMPTHVLTSILDGKVVSYSKYDDAYRDITNQSPDRKEDR